MLKNVYEYINDNDFRMTIFFNRVHIINYDSIKSIKNNEVIIFVNNRLIKINGNNLVLNKLLDSEVLIIGNVSSIGIVNE